MEDPHRLPGRGERRHFGPSWPEAADRKSRNLFAFAADGRALLRLFACGSWFLALYLPYLALLALTRNPGRPALARLSRKRLSRDLLRLAGIRLTIFGSPPEAPALIVANHLSWLDALLILAAAAPAPVTLERKLPGYALLAASVGALEIRRSRLSGLPALVAGLGELLAAGECVLFFPEGSTSFGDGLKPFHPALFQAAVDRQAPIACASVSYRLPPPQASPERCVHWVDWTPFIVHLWRLLGLRRLEARLAWGAILPPPADRRAACAAAAAEVQRLCAKFPPLSPRLPR
jgi:1-acyl-sn-glycerol-3-phosphate acyltransferase